MVSSSRIILLNGASSAGKSTLAGRLHERLDAPFLLISPDLLIDAGVRPVRRETAGPFDWVGAVRPRFFDGFHRCVAGFAAAGNDLLVDHVVEHASWRAQLDDLLAGVDVFWVGVHCDLDEIDRRELARGDRTPGESRAHVEIDRIHEHGPYDLTVDTTAGVTDAVVSTVLEAWQLRTRAT